MMTNYQNIMTVVGPAEDEKNNLLPNLILFQKLTAFMYIPKASI